MPEDDSCFQQIAEFFAIWFISELGYAPACFPSVPVTHDAAGNLTKDHRGKSYEYDYENRMIRIFIDTNTDGDYDAGTDANIGEFTYDALGRRIHKVLPDSHRMILAAV